MLNSPKQTYNKTWVPQRCAFHGSDSGL